MKKPKIKVPRIRVYSFMLLALLALLAMSAYTTILQGMYNDRHSGKHRAGKYTPNRCHA